MSRRHLLVGVAAGAALVLAACAAPAPTGEHTPEPAPVESSTGAPQRLLDGSCDRLLTAAEVSGVLAAAYEPQAQEERETYLAPLAGGLSCPFQDESGVRSVWVTAFPLTTLPAADDTTCTAGVECFFTRAVGSYRVDGYVSGVAANASAVDALVALAAARLTGPVPAPSRPDGAWSVDIAVGDLQGLDVSELLADAQGPFAAEGGGFQPQSLVDAAAASGYGTFFWEGPAYASVGVEVLPAGGWLFDGVEGVAVDVAGASGARWIDDGYGSPVLLVTDGVNLARITAGGESDAALRFASAVLTAL